MEATKERRGWPNEGDNLCWCGHEWLDHGARGEAVGGKCNLCDCRKHETDPPTKAVEGGR